MKSEKWKTLFKRMGYSDADEVLEEFWDEISAIEADDGSGVSGDRRIVWQVLNGNPKANGFGISPFELYLRETAANNYGIAWELGKKSARRYHTKKFQNATKQHEETVQEHEDKISSLERDLKKFKELEVATLGKDTNINVDVTKSADRAFQSDYNYHHHRACLSDIITLYEAYQQETGLKYPVERLKSFDLARRKDAALERFRARFKNVDEELEPEE